MKNNLKIDLASRNFILWSHVLLISVGIIFVGFFSWRLYGGMLGNSKNIEEILDLQDRVTIEVIDMKKLNSIQQQLDGKRLTDPDTRYINPFIARQKNEL